MQAAIHVDNAAALQAAVEAGHSSIYVTGVIDRLSSLRLKPGQVLHGEGERAELHFRPGQPGVMLSADNQVSGLRLRTDLPQVAVGLSDDQPDLGQIALSDIHCHGRVHLEAAQAKTGSLVLRNIHVANADARLAAHRPAGFGVEVLLGALSVYNSSKDPASVWQLSAYNLSAGSKAHPVRGSGVFVFGGDYIAPATDPATAPGPDTKGGQIRVEVLETGEVWSDGGIPAGVGNLITGGVFVGSGVVAEHVHSHGAVTTFGQNDMVLDNWGTIARWQAAAPLVSHGPSGIGVVNFGQIQALVVTAPITTHGLGARGFNLYDGSLGTGDFAAIATYGDGAIGIQLSKPFGRITVHGNVTTTGGSGDSLVRGKVVNLKAHALSLKDGAQGERLAIEGDARAEGDGINALDLDAGRAGIGAIVVAGNSV